MRANYCRRGIGPSKLTGHRHVPVSGCHFGETARGYLNAKPNVIDTAGPDYARDFSMCSRKEFRLLTRDARASGISNLRGNLRARVHANLSPLDKKILSSMETLPSGNGGFYFVPLMKRLERLNLEKVTLAVIAFPSFLSLSLFLFFNTQNSLQTLFAECVSVIQENCRCRFFEGH